jgi:outer membrane protein OmpA-like peptidoglycan-associated protein
MPRDDGGMTWLRVNVNAGLGQQYLRIVDEKPFKQSMVFGPAQLKEALDRDGKVALYGIHFDLDKATLKPDSVKQLQHVVTLMQNYPKLKLEVQGHTDNQGKADYNVKLSQKRAETVNQYLQLFGISSERLQPKGYGQTKPVATNATDEGRAKNRRVELVKK